MQPDFWPDFLLHVLTSPEHILTFNAWETTALLPWEVNKITTKIKTVYFLWENFQNTITLFNNKTENALNKNLTYYKNHKTVNPMLVNTSPWVFLTNHFKLAFFFSIFKVTAHHAIATLFPFLLYFIFFFVLLFLACINLPRNRLIFVMVLPLSFFCVYAFCLFISEPMPPQSARSVYNKVEPMAQKLKLISDHLTKYNVATDPYTCLSAQLNQPKKNINKLNTPQTFKYAIDNLTSKQSNFVSFLFSKPTPQQMYPSALLDFKLTQTTYINHAASRHLGLSLQHRSYALPGMSSFFKFPWNYLARFADENPALFSDTSWQKIKVRAFFEFMFSRCPDLTTRHETFDSIKQFYNRSYLLEPTRVSLARSNYWSRWGNPNYSRIPWANWAIQAYGSSYFFKTYGNWLFKGYGKPECFLYPQNIYSYLKYGYKSVQQLDKSTLIHLTQNNQVEHAGERFVFLTQKTTESELPPQNFPWKPTYLVHVSDPLLHEQNSNIPQSFLNMYTGKTQISTYTSWLGFNSYEEKEFNELKVKPDDFVLEPQKLKRTQPAEVKLLLFSFLTPNGTTIVPLPIPKQYLKIVKPHPILFDPDATLVNWRKWPEVGAERVVTGGIRHRYKTRHFNWRWNHWRNILCLFYPNEYGWSLDKKTQKTITEYVCTSLNKQLVNMASFNKTANEMHNEFSFSPQNVKLLLYPEIIYSWAQEHIKPQLAHIDKQLNDTIVNEHDIFIHNKNKKIFKKQFLSVNALKEVFFPFNWNRYRSSQLLEAASFSDFFLKGLGKKMNPFDQKKMFIFLTEGVKENYRLYEYTRFFDKQTYDIEPSAAARGRVKLRRRFGDLPAFYWRKEMHWAITPQTYGFTKDNSLTAADLEENKKTLKTSVNGLSAQLLHAHQRAKEVTKQLYPQITKKVLDLFVLPISDSEKKKKVSLMYRNTTTAWGQFWINQYCLHQPETYAVSQINLNYSDLKAKNKKLLIQLFQQNPLSTYSINRTLDLLWLQNKRNDSVYNAYSSLYNNNNANILKSETKQANYLTKLQRNIWGYGIKQELKEAATFKMSKFSPKNRIPGQQNPLELFSTQIKKPYQTANAMYRIEKLKFKNTVSLWECSLEKNKKDNLFFWVNQKTFIDNEPSVIKIYRFFIFYLAFVTLPSLAIAGSFLQVRDQRNRRFDTNTKTADKIQNENYKWKSYLKKQCIIWGGAGSMELLSLEVTEPAKLYTQTKNRYNIFILVLNWLRLSKTKVPVVFMVISMFFVLCAVHGVPLFLQLASVLCLVATFVVQFAITAAAPLINNSFLFKAVMKRAHGTPLRWVVSRRRARIFVWSSCLLGSWHYWQHNEYGSIESEQEIIKSLISSLLVILFLGFIYWIKKTKVGKEHDKLLTTTQFCLLGYFSSVITTGLVLQASSFVPPQTYYVSAVFFTVILLYKQQKNVGFLAVLALLGETLNWYSELRPGFFYSFIISGYVVNRLYTELNFWKDSDTNKTLNKAFELFLFIVTFFLMSNGIIRYLQYVHSVPTIGLLLASIWGLINLLLAGPNHKKTLNTVNPLLLFFAITAIVSMHFYFEENHSFLKLSAENVQLFTAVWVWSFLRTFRTTKMYKNSYLSFSYLAVQAPIVTIVYFNLLSPVGHNKTNFLLCLFCSAELLYCFMRKHQNPISTKSIKTKLFCSFFVIFVVTLFICELVPCLRYAFFLSSSVLVNVTFIICFFCTHTYINAARSDNIDDIKGLVQTALYLQKITYLFFTTVSLSLVLLLGSVLYIIVLMQSYMVLVAAICLVCLVLSSFISLIHIFYNVLSTGQSAKSKKLYILQKTAALKLQQKIDLRVVNKTKNMSESSLKYYKKYQKWKQDTETRINKARRVLKEEPHIQYHILCWTAGLNYESAAVAIKFYIFVTFFYYFAAPSSTLEIEPYYLFEMLVLSLLYISHFILVKTPLKQSRTWWWKPWPIFFHTYTGGQFPLNFFFLPLLYLIGAPCSFCFFFLLMYLVQMRMRQTYIYYLLEGWVGGFFYYNYSLRRGMFAERHYETLLYIWRFTKKAAYAFWCFCTPFLAERRRKGLIFYWTLF